jgi:hypothetical protein
MLTRRRITDLLDGKRESLESRHQGTAEVWLYRIEQGIARRKVNNIGAQSQAARGEKRGRFSPSFSTVS